MKSALFAFLALSLKIASASDWQPLFNARDLSGWTNVNCAPSTWSVSNGIIISTGIPTGVLRTLREYENFILELEWRHLKPGGNAGLFVHSGALPVKGQPFTKAIEIQIIDRDHPEGIATRHGDVFAIQGATFEPDRPHPRGWMRCLPSEKRVRPVGEWNHYRVECRDGRVTLAVNGKEVSGGSKCNPSRGFIVLESEGSECHFRNLRIQELTPSREVPPTRLVSLYTGVDLSGWKTTAPANVWRPKDWILECAGAGNPGLTTEREFADFEFMFDWRFKSSGEASIRFAANQNVHVPISSTNSGWNRMRIWRTGDQLKYWLNDAQYTETRLIPERTAIVLGSGPIEFANLFIDDVSIGSKRVALVAGGGMRDNNVPADRAHLQSPFGAELDSAGNLYIVEMVGQRVLKVDTNGIISVLAGTGEKGSRGDGGPALQAQFNGPHSIAVTPSGDIYVADTWNNRVRMIDARTGMISTIAGTGNKGFSGDGGPAVKAEFGAIYCASLDPKNENLYLADLDNRRIRVVNLKTGIVKTVAGNGQKGVPKDGAAATDAPLVDPRAVIANGEGEIYILERSGHALRVVDAKGLIRTVAGTGEKGNSGDGGDARQATLNGPKHLCFDHDGRVIIADTENHVIRGYDPRTGKIQRIAGSGQRDRDGIGWPALEVELNQPHGVFVDARGALYISDSSNHRVLRVDL